MTTWQQFTDEAPTLAAAVEARLTAHKHHVLATLRADGSPRVSGTEVEIYEGVLLLGSMPGARKVLDLQRDPRFALHSNPGHHTMDGGDAKLAGRARQLAGDELAPVIAHYPEEVRDAEVFELDLAEVALTTVSEDKLHVDLWRPGRAVERFTR
ncbi:pyridoxamine 5'-phosphate oxidase family protein [Rhodococcus spelaei]|uniref:Pyridoxamine 5'-phosphate oxidase family protein n=1 Tax=Rhodococcus spelaei TaxID=2546320 RepID=A0A541BAE9_9NOCA|nr:pyridoxamine 5'-phosphate oxidase family protein [Rhodococcus spelaei]TQF69305.1 pyridoxamine 5'-phosphate oxidase family protein [Rhodococcus spelaei]